MSSGPRVELRRTYRFCASHRLARSDRSDAENLELYGEASLPSGHGHNYRVTLVLEGPCDAGSGRVLDLREVDRVVEEEVLEPFDHRNLNVDLPSLHGRVPTVEVLLQDIWERLARRLPGGLLRAVELRQDEFLSGVYRGP